MVHFQTLIEALQYWAKKRADVPAFIFRDKEHARRVLTWSTIHALSGRFAALLRARLELRRGHLVALTLPNSPERVICEAGILMNRAASVNAQCMLADGSDLLRTLRVSGARAVIVDPDIPNSPWDVLKRYVITVQADKEEKDDRECLIGVESESLPELKYVFFVRRVQGEGPDDFLGRLGTLQDWFQDDDIAPDDVITVCSTSGTSGFSKLVVYTNDMIVIEQDFSEDLPPDGTVTMNIAPFGWIGGYPGNVFLFGSSSVACDIRGGGIPEKMPEFIWRCIQEENVSSMLLSPAYLPGLVELAKSSQVSGDGRERGTDEKTNATCTVNACDPKTCAAEAKSACAGIRKVEEASESCCSPSEVLHEGDKTTSTSGCATEKKTTCTTGFATGKTSTCTTGCATKKCAERKEGLMLREMNTEQDNTDDANKEKAARSKKAMRLIYLGGMPVSRSMVKSALVLADTVLVAYGSTDFSLVSTIVVTEGSVQDLVDHDTGPPAKGVEVKIVSQKDENVEMPQDQQGLILVKRTNILREGYLNDPEATAAAFTKDGYFRTGDIGCIDSRGHVIVEGRGSDAIMRGPYIFYPAWLELRICACPGVGHAIVVGVPDPFLVEELCACIVFDNNHDEDGGEDDEMRLARVREFVEGDIVAKEDDPLSPRPRYYLRFQSFPTTYTEKPRRKQVKKEAADMLGLSSSTAS